jgi:cbb3-type cytochrome oxidase subunit 3
MCSDAAGNQAAVINRTITIVDTIPPVLTVNGNIQAYVPAGEAYNDLGARSIDEYSGDLTANISVAGLDAIATTTSNVGVSFLITYESFDTKRNVATAFRNVTIILPISSSSSSSSAPIAAGAAAGAIFSILVVLFVLWRRRQRRDEAATSTLLVDNPDEIDSKHLVLREVINQGNFRVVHRGELKV